MPNVENMWINSENIMGKAGKSFTLFNIQNIKPAWLCKTTQVLPPTIHTTSHTISTAKNNLVTVAIAGLSTLSTALIIMSMNIFNKRRIVK